MLTFQRCSDVSRIAGRLRTKPRIVICRIGTVQNQGYVCHWPDAGVCYERHAWKRIPASRTEEFDDCHRR